MAALHGVAPSKRILCWPGWLDNAGSFDALAPFLTAQGYLLVCCDPPGCGRSDHYSPVTKYNDFYEPAFVMEALHALGWGSAPCNLMAHSRGGSVALLTVSAFPTHFCRLLLFDSSLAVHVAPAHIARDMRSAYDTDALNRRRKARVFASLRDVVVHNYGNKLFPKRMLTAAAIARRHALPLQDGTWTFSHDVRTYGETQPLRLSPRQVQQFLANLTVPTLLVMGTKSRIGAWALKDKAEAMSAFREHASASFPDDALAQESFLSFHEQRWAEFQHRLQSVGTRIHVQWCEGGQHHCHSDQPGPVSSIVLKWMENTGSSEVAIDKKLHDRHNASQLQPVAVRSASRL